MRHVYVWLTLMLLTASAYSASLPIEKAEHAKPATAIGAILERLSDTESESDESRSDDTDSESGSYPEIDSDSDTDSDSDEKYKRLPYFSAQFPHFSAQFPPPPANAVFHSYKYPERPFDE